MGDRSLVAAKADIRQQAIKGGEVPEAVIPIDATIERSIFEDALVCGVTPSCLANEL
jgi:hypothetical protein